MRLDFRWIFVYKDKSNLKINNIYEQEYRGGVEDNIFGEENIGIILDKQIPLEQYILEDRTFRWELKQFMYICSRHQKK